MSSALRNIILTNQIQVCDKSSVEMSLKRRIAAGLKAFCEWIPPASDTGLTRANNIQAKQYL
jgi:hypothetical protein